MKINASIKNLKNYKIYLKVNQAIDEFLQKKGYLKLDLPLLSPALIPESYLEFFETHFNYLNRRRKLYLTPSPELFLKRLLTYGIGNCYYLGKSFRNGELPSDLHSPEFTMLEFYRIKADYMEVAGEVLEMLQYITQKIKDQKPKIKTTDQRLKINYQNKLISFDRWEKISVVGAFKKYCQITTEELLNKSLFLKRAKQKGYGIRNFSYEDIFSQIYVQEIEPYLGKNGHPTLIYDYPKPLAALAKLNPDSKTAQRFEFYIAGIELGDCYTELTDWKENERRFDLEKNKRKKNKQAQHLIDKGFIKALKYGLVNCSGIAIGVDRLAMIFADLKSINQLKLISIQ